VSEEIRIMVVDDHDTFRDPLAFMLEREPDLTVVARPRSLSEAREVLQSADPLLLVAGSAVFRPTPHPVPLYSAECVEGEFSEVQIQDRA
jgi:hypothetical protein